jgi:serine/threonine-protein kinase
MSQDNKGRTMIGTLAPQTHPRPPSLSPEQPTIMPVRPSASMDAPTIVPTRPGGIPTTPPPAATVAMRPRSEPVLPPDPDADMFVGQELCGYTIRRKLAEGGMGVVYEGVHQKIGRLGAIKVLKPEFCRSEDVVERFYQEARAVNSIRHENIVDIYDFGRDAQGRVFFVMEYLEGEPLSARIRRGALTWPEAFPILEQTLRALKAAHDKGFVHRDLKPDNIWLRYVEGRVQVKLLDFGIAKLVGSESPREKLTQTGSVIGTPHYMSPEQINGSKDVDQRTDLYALGVITYEMFAGVTPFVGDTLQAIMTGHLFREPPRLADIPQNLGVPPQIAEIIDRMLVKEAAGRYDSVGEVLDDLYDVNGNRWPTHAGTLNQLRPTRGPTLMAPAAVSPPRPRKRSGSGAVIGLIAVAALGGAGFAVWKSQQPAEQVAMAPPKGPEPETPKEKTPVEKPTPPPAPNEDEARKNAEATLRGSLREAEPIVRVHGADALGAIKDTDSIPDLTRLTEADDDDSVRGHTAGALGAIGATSTLGLLTKLEAGAPPPLKVYYASALARLGDKAAPKRLLAYARSKDLAVGFAATIALAEISQPGDQKAIAALGAMTEHEAELNKLQPFAGALLLTKMAALRDKQARELLYETLKAADEAARLAAAEGLAKLGDDAGRALLHDTAANPKSPNQLVAAVAQVALGEYSGLKTITDALTAKDPEVRRLAARALGDIGEKPSLPVLLGLASDQDWTVRIAAAKAIIAIVGINTAVLAQASVDWTKNALASQDWATRKAAAGVLADIPSDQAVPLLAKAIADRNREVRLAVSKTAGKMKSAGAAAEVVAAVATETDPEVKEQQIKSLGEIGKVAGPAARDTLAQLSEQPGRLGVLAAGSLIGVGDDTGNAKLEAAVASGRPELRLAAVEAASATHNPIVVPTLKIGLFDKVDNIKFLAAEGLSMMNAEKAAAEPVLSVMLKSKDAGMVSRAIAALNRFGVSVKGAQTAAEMLDSADPKQRLAAVPIVRTMPVAERVPLLRRLVVDPDTEVRRAGVDAIESIASAAKDEAKKLYKPLVKDADAVVRSKAAGQLSRLVDSTVVTANVTPPPPPPPPPQDPLLKLEDALKAATAEAATAKTAYDALLAEFATAISPSDHDGKTPDDASKALAHVRELPAKINAAGKTLDSAATNVEVAAKALADAAGASPPPTTVKLVTDSQADAARARGHATAARAKMGEVSQKARDFIEDKTDGVLALIARADSSIGAGRFAAAQRDLDEAAKQLRVLKQRVVSIDQSYARLYEAKAKATQDPAANRALLMQAAAAYTRIINAGPGQLADTARTRVAEINDDLKNAAAP